MTGRCDTQPADPDTPPPAKLDPATLVLRGTPTRPVRIRRNVVIALSATTFAALGATTWMALTPPALRASGEELAERQAEPTGADEKLADIPASYDAIPKLGPPLPGDLGRPILARQQATVSGGSGPGQAAEADPVAEAYRKREAARAAAQGSGIMMTLRGASAGPDRVQAAIAGALEPDGAAAPRSSDTSGTSVVGPSIDGINPYAMRESPSPWTISAGTIIAASLLTGLNSDLPGIVIAQVSENIVDSATGRTLLIPQGSRLIGRYENGLRFHQTRALLVWQRILFPNGSSIRLDDMPATDASGQVGISDRVDLHGGALLKGVALSTLLGVGSELSFGDNESEIVRALREAGQSSGNQAGQDIVRRSLDIQPTITVRPGWPVRVLVHRDLILRPWTE
ncbi:type IV secretion system protein VirB10 [Sphingomonas laterariae]|uniref:Type IV secretion system protein VirB10 n=1 Tax=Edaphosphingomonas laterariae TaxID=861865 RepID=A0A239J0L6_9SPHN|nr:TrbI/VirB10 family protein [Sphingomonas laterariae]SNS99380.1 type IV secretion system protein VirB10 [Sphingomonas laterariae]